MSTPEGTQPQSSRVPNLLRGSLATSNCTEILVRVRRKDQNWSKGAICSYFPWSSLEAEALDISWLLVTVWGGAVIWQEIQFRESCSWQINQGWSSEESAAFGSQVRALTEMIMYEGQAKLIVWGTRRRCRTQFSYPLTN